MPSQPPGRSSSTALQTEDQPAGAGQDRPRLSARTRRVLLLAFVLLAGAAFRITPLADNRFHPDEALFATLGRLIITGKDPLLTETTLLVDKPPLLYYLLAAGISVSWGSEVSARLPGLFASMITVALMARLAWRLWGRGAAAPLAALFVALSPFVIAFAPTAFSDPLMLMWALAGLTAAAGGRWFAAGLLLGCALATKQTGVLFLPLAAALGVAAGLKRPARLRDALAVLLRFASGLGVVLALMLGWEALRGGAGGAWLAGIVTNNPGGLAAPTELGERALGWLRLLHEFTGSTLLDLTLLTLLAALPVLEFAAGRGRGARASVAILAFAAAYLALHWLAAVPLLDRYLLPLVPLLALLVARALTLVAARLPRREPRVLAAAGLAAGLLLLPGALAAARSAVPVGGDHGAYDGIDAVAEAVAALPEGSVVYTDSLGWPLAYYLFDAYVYRAPFETPADLANDLRTFGADGTERVLVMPGWRDHRPVLSAVRAAGFHPEVMLRTTNRHGEASFVVYRLVRQ